MTKRTRKIPYRGVRIQPLSNRAHSCLRCSRHERCGRAVAPIYEDIALAAEEMLGSAVVTGKTTFKVESRRSDKSFPLTSPELSKRLGAHLVAAHPQVKVDVHQPQVTINVEVRANVAYVYADTLRGPGGLPVGVSSQGLLLISGGIDSPVAGWLAMRRGIRLAAIHFHSIPYTSERAQKEGG